MIQIDRARELFLDDHAVAGLPILPTAMGLDLLVRGAALPADDRCAVELRDIAVGPPVEVATPRTLRLTADLMTTDSSESEEWWCELSSPENPDPHFSARVRAGNAEPTTAQTQPAPLTDLRVERGSVYPPFFHGPTFQVVQAFGRTSSGFAAMMADCLPELRWSVGRLQTRPRVLELFMQGCGLVALAESGRIMIPASIDQLIWHQPALRPSAGIPERPVFAEISPRHNDISAAVDTFDGHVIDADGRPLLDVVGYHTRDLGHPPDLERAATLRRKLAQPEGVSR